ncbi:MAG: hypothetical protein ACHQ9S_13375 [Candidatus Binatia bacterium]
MPGNRGIAHHRVFISLACLALWVLLAMAGTGCTGDRSPSENGGSSAASSGTAPVFRNLGKRAESPL